MTKHCDSDKLGLHSKRAHWIRNPIFYIYRRISAMPLFHLFPANIVAQPCCDIVCRNNLSQTASSKK